MTDELKFLVFAIEYYRSVKGLSGSEVIDLFEKYGISQLIVDNYFLYHAESPDLMVKEIDHFIQTGNLIDAPLA